VALECQARQTLTVGGRGTYLLELVRYIHLNPLRAAMVKSMGELEACPWSDHMVLVGKRICALS